MLALVAHDETHGFDLARQLDAAGPVGQAFTVPRSVVYRALDRLAEGGLVEEAGTTPGLRGPPRTLLRATPAGRAVAEEWLTVPVRHVRDIRTDLMAKLAILYRYRQGRGAADLVSSQAARIRPVVDSLEEARAEASGYHWVLATWRLETARAALRFLEDVAGFAGLPSAADDGRQGGGDARPGH